jgi:Cytochrome b5-like Heme/Steroid binding domain
MNSSSVAVVAAMRDSKVSERFDTMSVRDSAAGCDDAEEDEMSMVRTESFASLDEDENDDEEAAAVDTVTKQSTPQHEELCDACPYCSDVCDNPSCLLCDVKTRRSSSFDCSCLLRHRHQQQKQLQPREPHDHQYHSAGEHLPPVEKRFYTKCQVRRHNHAGSVWLVAGDKIYNATPYLACHPAGEAAILRKSGGVIDVTRDLEFHSSAGKKLFRSLEIGRLVPCPGGDHCTNATSPSLLVQDKPIEQQPGVSYWWEFWNR